MVQLEGCLLLLRKHRGVVWDRRVNGCVFIYDWPNLQFQISDRAYHSSSPSSLWVLLCLLSDGASRREKETVLLQFSFSFLSHFFSKTFPGTFIQPWALEPALQEGFYFWSSRVSALRDTAASSLKVNPGVWYLTAVLSFLLAWQKRLSFDGFSWIRTQDRRLPCAASRYLNTYRGDVITDDRCVKLLWCWRWEMHD